MSIQLTPEQEALVQAQLQTGQFQTAEEVIQTALQLLVNRSSAKRLRITPAAQGSGYSDTALHHDQVLTHLDAES
jgi:Arc/MetJ-type ribon-helix-helix transcriptional regulator